MESKEIPIYPLSLNWFVLALRGGNPFTFARYGDGEWGAILFDETIPENCDGVKLTHLLGFALGRTISEPKGYYHGMVRIAMKMLGGQIREHLNEIRCPLRWWDGTAFVDASRAGGLAPLVQALRGREIVYAGPPHLHGIQDFLPCREFVQVPPREAFDFVPEICWKIVSVVREGDVVGISAGPAAKIIIYTLYEMLTAGRVTMIDFGSLWDGFCGVYSRKYMQDPDWQKLIPENLGDHS